MNDGWYGALKETIQQQQNQLVWVSEGKVTETGQLLVLFRCIEQLYTSCLSELLSHEVTASLLCSGGWHYRG